MENEKRTCHMTSERRLIDANALKGAIRMESWKKETQIQLALDYIDIIIDEQTKVDAVVLPCKVGDTVYGRFNYYGTEIHECKVAKVKMCQFKDKSLHCFLDVEFDIIDPYFRDGRLMHCGQQAVLGEDYGSWHRAYLTREEAEVALVKMDGDGNG